MKVKTKEKRLTFPLGNAGELYLAVHDRNIISDKGEYSLENF